MKNIGIACIVFSFFFLLSQQVAAATVINTNLNVQTGTDFRVVATPTSTPTPSAVRVRVIATPTPAVQNIVPVRAVTSAVNLPIFAKISSPKGGEDITIGDKQSEVLFTYGGSFDMSVGGNYGYHLELWRNGQLLGNVDNFDRYPLNPYKNAVTFGWKPGQYFQKDEQYGTRSLKTAEAGTGYALRLVIDLAYADPGSGVTKYKDIAEDMSDGTFTFLPKPKTLKVFTPESYSVAFSYPNGGEYLPLKKRVDLVFDYSGTFDQEQGGSYDYRIELWQNGTRLGSVHTLTDFQLDINKKQVTYGLVPENYFTEEDNIPKTVKIIPGSGYQFKVILQQASTPEGASETQFRELASDMTDKPFTISPAIKNPLAEGLTAITTPIFSFFARLGGLFAGGGPKVLPQ